MIIWFKQGTTYFYNFGRLQPTWDVNPLWFCKHQVSGGTNPLRFASTNLLESQAPLYLQAPTCRRHQSPLNLFMQSTPPLKFMFHHISRLDTEANSLVRPHTTTFNLDLLRFFSFSTITFSFWFTSNLPSCHTTQLYIIHSLVAHISHFTITYTMFMYVFSHICQPACVRTHTMISDSFLIEPNLYIALLFSLSSHTYYTCALHMIILSLCTLCFPHSCAWGHMCFVIFFDPHTTILSSITHALHFSIYMCALWIWNAFLVLSAFFLTSRMHISCCLDTSSY